MRVILSWRGDCQWQAGAAGQLKQARVLLAAWEHYTS